MPASRLHIYNTLTRSKEPFVPRVAGEAQVYVCGPTVYSFVHIGNARTFTSFDVVVRYLRHLGLKVSYVRNYTDVDDKIIKAANEAKVSASELSERFIAEFEKDAAALRLVQPDVSPRVTQTMPGIISVIERIIANGHGYVSEGDVYFSVSSWKAYAKLSRRDLEDLRSGERNTTGEAKRDPLDFALWKGAKPGEPSWPSPWGNGRPGWHIECSAMVEQHLGKTIDLHGGGLDLIFPHHENELAQSEAANACPFCNTWMHGGFLDIEGAKMSKSLGNVVRLRDALEKVDAEGLRSFFLSTHYRAPIQFSEKSIYDAEARLEYFYETLQKAQAKVAAAPASEGPLHVDPAKFLAQFEERMDDDFNFAGGLGVVSELFSAINELCDKAPNKDAKLQARTLAALLDVARKIGAVLGIFEDPPAEWLARRRDRQVIRKGIDRAAVEQLLEQRKAARANKQWAESDQVRDALVKLGIEVRDTPAGQTWKVAATHPDV